MYKECVPKNNDERYRAECRANERKDRCEMEEIEGIKICEWTWKQNFEPVKFRLSVYQSNASKKFQYAKDLLVDIKRNFSFLYIGKKLFEILMLIWRFFIALPRKIFDAILNVSQIFLIFFVMFAVKFFRNFTFSNPLCMFMLKTTINKMQIIQEKKTSMFWYIFMLSLSFNRLMLLWYYAEFTVKTVELERLREFNVYTWLQIIVGVNLLRHYTMNFSEIQYQSFQVYPFVASGIINAAMIASPRHKEHQIVATYYYHHPFWTIYFLHITQIQEFLFWPKLLDTLKNIYKKVNRTE
jgi:hypothetical protein